MAYPDLVLATAGLRSYWRFNDALLSATALDAGPQAAHGTLQGTAVRQVSCLEYDDADYSLNGQLTSQGVFVPVSGGLYAFAGASAPFTVELLIRAGLLSGSNRTLIDRTGGSPANGWRVTTVNTDVRFETVSAGVVTAVCLIPGHVILQSGSQHVAFVVGASTIQGYLEGVATGSAVARPSIPDASAATNMAFGRLIVAGNAWSGHMDEVAIYDQAVPAADLLLHAGAKAASPSYCAAVRNTGGLSFYWLLDEAAGAATMAAEWGGKTGTLQGNPALEQPPLTVNPKSGGVSIAFDGIDDGVIAIGLNTDFVYATNASFSFEMLISLASIGAGIVRTLLDKRNLSTPGAELGWRVVQLNDTLVYEQWIGGAITASIATTSLAAGVIYHIVFARPSGQMQVWVNGVQIPGSPFAMAGNPTSNAVQLRLGVSQANTERFAGTLDNLAFYAPVLLQATIDRHIVVKNTPPTQPPLIVTGGTAATTAISIGGTAIVLEPPLVVTGGTVRTRATAIGATWISPPPPVIVGNSYVRTRATAIGVSVATVVPGGTFATRARAIGFGLTSYANTILKTSGILDYWPLDAPVVGPPWVVDNAADPSKPLSAGNGVTFHQWGYTPNTNYYKYGNGQSHELNRQAGSWEHVSETFWALNPTAAYSVELWISAHAIASVLGRQVIVEMCTRYPGDPFGPPPMSWDGFGIYRNKEAAGSSGQEVYAAFYRIGTAGVFLSAPDFFIGHMNAMTHLVLTVDVPGGNAILYRNGVVVGGPIVKPYPATHDLGTHFFVGAENDVDDTSKLQYTSLDNLSIYAGVLTPAQVLAHYTAGLALPTILLPVPGAGALARTRAAAIGATPILRHGIAIDRAAAIGATADATARVTSDAAITHAAAIGATVDADALIVGGNAFNRALALGATFIKGDLAIDASTGVVPAITHAMVNDGTRPVIVDLSRQTGGPVIGRAGRSPVSGRGGRQPVVAR